MIKMMTANKGTGEKIRYATEVDPRWLKEQLLERTSANPDEICVMKHKTIPDYFVGEENGLRGIMVDDKKRAVKMPRRQWLVEASENSWRHFDLVPA